ncbi:sporadically distributed protein, TIGR04141 family [Ruegeria sp. PBVC088]|nr:sporadically distributed protein, TIGR04141 family [Ruegeria sp. PBVC088]
MFVPSGGRILAICFGHVHIALNDDAFVRQFGLKVTLNAVSREQLRSLDTATPDAVTVQKRVQTSKDSDLQAFGVDMYRDLARVAAGTPKDKDFAQFVAGKDALKVIAKDKPDQVQALCDRMLAMYLLEDYKADFSWVDRMQMVSEKDVIAQLDEKLFEALDKLRAGENADLHMSPPEIVDYTEGNQLHYNGFGSNGSDFESLSIEDYVDELNRCDFDGEVIELKEKHYISAKKDNEEKFDQKWKVYDCFIFETSLGENGNEKHYVLFAGCWYCVDQDFKAEVDEAYDALEKVNIVGPTTCLNERTLIEELVNTRDDLLKLDQQKINPKGVKYGNLEPCDFFSASREFIHLKDGHSSGSISHLWSQGVVSAEAFLTDHDFKVKLRRIVKSESDKKAGGTAFEELLPMAAQKPIRTDFKVVYGIMRKPYKDGSLGLPFFSKVSLQAAVKRLEEFGIPVALELIQKPASDAEAGEDE